MPAWLVPHAVLALVYLMTMALTLSGCVSPALRLSSDHPARPDAPSGISADPAAILHNDRSTYAGGETGRGPESRNAQASAEPDGTRSAPYVGPGVVRRVGDGQLDIQHGAIPGFMMGMTMTFPLAAEIRDQSFEVGDRILFRIERLEGDVYQIFSTEPAGPEETVGEPRG